MLGIGKGEGIYECLKNEWLLLWLLNGGVWQYFVFFGFVRFFDVVLYFELMDISDLVVDGVGR